MEYEGRATLHYESKRNLTRPKNLEKTINLLRDIGKGVKNIKKIRDVSVYFSIGENTFAPYEVRLEGTHSGLQEAVSKMVKHAGPPYSVTGDYDTIDAALESYGYFSQAYLEKQGMMLMAPARVFKKS